VLHRRLYWSSSSYAYMSSAFVVCSVCLIRKRRNISRVGRYHEWTKYFFWSKIPPSACCVACETCDECNPCMPYRLAVPVTSPPILRTGRPGRGAELSTEETFDSTAGVLQACEHKRQRSPPQVRGWPALSCPWTLCFVSL